MPWGIAIASSLWEFLKKSQRIINLLNIWIIVVTLIYFNSVKLFVFLLCQSGCFAGTMRKVFSESIGAPKVPSVSWQDVGGLEHLKKEILRSLRSNMFNTGLKRSGTDTPCQRNQTHNALVTKGHLEQPAPLCYSKNTLSHDNLQSWYIRSTLWNDDSFSHRMTYCLCGSCLLKWVFQFTVLLI